MYGVRVAVCGLEVYRVRCLVFQGGFRIIQFRI